jgi:hypothetical protein
MSKFVYILGNLYDSHYIKSLRPHTCVIDREVFSSVEIEFHDGKKEIITVKTREDAYKVIEDFYVQSNIT